MKKLIGAIIGTGLIFATALPAFATDCTIGTSGPFSKNTCTQKAPKTALYFQKNRALVIKVQSSGAYTGGNNQDFNTTVDSGGITTEGATSNIDPAVAVDPDGGTIVSPVTDVNSSSVDVDQSASAPGGGSINTSGPFSTNTVDVNHSKTAVVGMHNEALVVVKQDSIADTGGNSMSFNTTTSGNIHTGSAQSNVTSNMYVNYSAVSITQ